MFTVLSTVAAAIVTFLYIFAVLCKNQTPLLGGPSEKLGLLSCTVIRQDCYHWQLDDLAAGFQNGILLFISLFSAHYLCQISL